MRERWMALCVLGLCILVGCTPGDDQTKRGVQAEEEAVTLTLAAAASLQYALEEELIPLFEQSHTGITVRGTYDSSGKLQTQIEQGLEADVFLSAAMQQMEALVEQALVDGETVTALLENRVVLVAPTGTDTPVTGFADILQAERIALGDPDSVPAGQYAQEIFAGLGIWEEVRTRASFGTNVTEVLSWVAEGSADVGVVYSTDAAMTDRVTVVAEAPEGTRQVLYPAGIVADTPHREAAEQLLAFLSSPEALACFAEYGFTPCKQ